MRGRVRLSTTLPGKVWERIVRGGLEEEEEVEGVAPKPGPLWLKI